jgi:hypothetical protein
MDGTFPLTQVIYLLNNPSFNNPKWVELFHPLELQQKLNEHNGDCLGRYYLRRCLTKFLLC